MGRMSENGVVVDARDRSCHFRYPAFVNFCAMARWLSRCQKGDLLNKTVIQSFEAIKSLGMDLCSC